MNTDRKRQKMHLWPYLISFFNTNKLLVRPTDEDTHTHSNWKTLNDVSFKLTNAHLFSHRPWTMFTDQTWRRRPSTTTHCWWQCGRLTKRWDYESTSKINNSRFVVSWFVEFHTSTLVICFNNSKGFSRQIFMKHVTSTDAEKRPPLR